MLKKIACFIMVFILLFSLNQRIFANAESNEGKVRLGSFIIAGLERNITDEEKPEWFKEYYKGFEEWEKQAENRNKKIWDYSGENELWVTKEQAAEITILYSDDMLPLMFTPDELDSVFDDFSGIEYLSNLKTIGTTIPPSEGYDYSNGINAYPFSREQIAVYYQKLVESFRRTDAKEVWPNLDFNTLRSNQDYPWDKSLRNITNEKIESNKDKVVKKIDDSKLTDEEKRRLKDEVDIKVAEIKEKINKLNAYDLSTHNFESAIEIEAIKEFTEIEKEIEKKEPIDISVSKKWSDNSTDKEVTIKLLKKKPTIVINPDVEGWEEEVIDIEMRSMPILYSASTLGSIENETASEENIPEGYEFVKGEDGQPITLTLNNENSYSGVFKNLPKYEKDGKTLAEYKVYEVKVDGYATSISGDQEKGFVVTNTAIEKRAVPVAKKWIGKEENGVVIHLYADGEDTGKKVELNRENNWQHVFTDLEKYKDDVEIIYTVKEDVIDGYTTDISGDMENGYLITNTNIKKVSVSGSKTWNDKGDQDGKRPDAITIRLWANGVEKVSKQVSKSDGWKWTFDNLPKYDNGQEIRYTISEDAVSGYIAEVKGYDVTNNYTPGKTSVQVTDIWNDNNNQDGKRPEKVVVKLFADGEETDKSIELKESNNWTAVFDELDEYQGGKKIAYTVKEEKVEGYETSISGDAIKGFTITNVYTPETVNVSGSKTWSDNNNQDGKRPEVITIRLLANGVEKASKQVSKLDGWKWTFDNIPKYDNGQEIRYTISEDAVSGYIAEVKGYDVTNSYVQDKPDKPNEPDKSDKSDKQDKPNTPKEKVLPNTGDSINILSYILLLGLSGSILLSFAVRKKKINN